MKFKNGQADLTKIEIVLTDFGLAEPDSKGGTPIFASPECFEKKEKKSDIFSFGRVILFLLLTKNQFVKWLHVPLKDETRLLSIRMLTSNVPDQPLTLISKMTSLEMPYRINLQAARMIFDDLRRHSNICLKPALMIAIDTDINAEISNGIENYVSELCDFRYAIFNKQFLMDELTISYFKNNFSKMTFALLSEATASSKRFFHRSQNTFNRIQNSFVTNEIHDQG